MKKGNPKKIVIAGMPQSGSTLLFNIICKIFDLKKKKYESYLYGPDNYKKVVNKTFLLNHNSNTTILIKEHHYCQFLEQWADIIFISKRDIRDCIASRRRRGKGLISKGKKKIGLHQYDEKTFEGFKHWCNYLTFDCVQLWEKVSYLFDYEFYTHNRNEVLKKIVDTLEMDNILISDLIKFIDFESKNENKFDLENKITKNGGIGKFKKYLSQKELEYIETYYSQWIFK